MEFSREGRTVIVQLSGDIDMTAVERVSGGIQSAIKNNDRGVVLDLGEVRYLDSSGIQMLFDLIRKLHTTRQSIALAVPEDSPLVTLLKITHIHEACPVAPTVEECLGSMESDPKLY